MLGWRVVAELASIVSGVSRGRVGFMFARALTPAGRRTRTFVLALGSVALVGTGPASAADKRHAAVVVDGNSGRVLMGESADEARYPASLTKMMTLYLTFEALESGKIKPNTPIRISSEAAAQQPSKLDLQVGEDRKAHV